MENVPSFQEGTEHNNPKCTQSVLSRHLAKIIQLQGNFAKVSLRNKCKSSKSCYTDCYTGNSKHFLNLGYLAADLIN